MRHARGVIRDAGKMGIVRQSRGFTLLEILVALSIAAVGLAAVSQSLTSSIGVTGQIEQRLFASWVASNRLAEIRLAREWRVDTQARNTVTEAGRTWYVLEEYSGTPDPDLARIDVTVYVDSAHDDAAANLFGYIVRPPSSGAG